MNKNTEQRLFMRLEALEKWLGGTPEQAGLATKVDSMRTEMDHKFATLRTDVDHRFDSILSSLKINNWLTGLIVTILVAGALRMVLLGMSS